MERSALTSDETVRAMQAKYGRPGVSGRKRQAATASSADAINVKIPRIKVIFILNFYKTLKCHRKNPVGLQISLRFSIWVQV